MAMPNTARPWTLEELHRLPDDGNKYELVDGELFVTPAPKEDHETIAARLTDLLGPYVAAHRLGRVYRPRAIMRYKGSEAEPDLMVRAERMRPKESWENAPMPVLIVEILSDSTRQRDFAQKRDFYMKSGIPAYWIVDGDRRCVTVVRPHREDMVVSTTLEWSPRGVETPLTISVEELFADAEQE
jgi:Uma2 family endonuclease